MCWTFLFVLLSCHGLVRGGNQLQTNTSTRFHLLKSLILANSKTTVTLDSAALQKFDQLSLRGRMNDTEASYSPGHVSFSANVEANQRTLGAEQTVIYDKILTNDGNGYDDRTGVFTCPVAGTYMFVVDSLSRPGIWLRLKVNKREVARLHVSPEVKSTTLTQFSRTVILKLKSGDHVKVENIVENGLIYYEKYSGFSGTLLY